MTDKTWLAEDGARLKSLREAAGLDRAALAHLCAVSAEQVRQLEDGGDAAFYGASIKRQLGRRLLRKLGEALPPDEPADLYTQPLALPPELLSTSRASRPLRRWARLFGTLAALLVVSVAVYSLRTVF